MYINVFLYTFYEKYAETDNKLLTYIVVYEFMCIKKMLNLVNKYIHIIII